MNQELIELILKDIEEKFKFTVEDMNRIPGGYMNHLWHLKGKKDRVLKIYSKERSNQKRLDFIEKALAYQCDLNSKNIKSPKLYVHNKKVIQVINSEHYMVMDYFEGYERSNKDILLHELVLLGETLATIHHSKVSQLTSTPVENHLILLDDYLSELVKNTENHLSIENLLPRLREIHSTINMNYDKDLKVGLTHSDFSNDNMLFNKESISILDFDRSRIAYQHQDIGRAMMSFAFNETSLDIDKVKAFIKGYSKVEEIDYEDIIKGLKLIWMIEVKWWMKSCFFEKESHSKVERFKREILWLTNHWYELNQIICD